MNANPAQLLVTHEHQERVRALARARQRKHRMGRQRIDYTPNAHAATVIDSLRTGYAGGDASSIINRIICEWTASRALHAAGPNPAGSGALGASARAR
jgi:hypothetical protein